MSVHYGMRVAVACGILGLAAVAGCKASQKGDGGTDGGAIEVGSSPMDVTSPDTGRDTAADGLPPMTRRRSFVVTSTLVPQADPSNMGNVQLPATHTFTMVLDWDRRIAILASATGQCVCVFEPSATGGTVRQTAGFGVGASSVSYQTMDVTVGAAGELSGTARGRGTALPAGYDAGLNEVAVSMSLAGIPDTQPPGFESDALKGAPVDPFTALRLVAAEPLPPGTRMTLVDLRGERIDIAPSSLVQMLAPAAFVFQPAEDRMWRYGNQYALSLDGVVDFAGNAHPPGTALTFATTAPPPLVAADGFESAAGATLAGAQVLSGVGAPTITGARSLYIPPLPGVDRPGRGPITQLALRIALDPTDTVVRFAYRTVNPADSVFLGGTPDYLLGSEGGAVSRANLGADSGPAVAVTIPGQGQVMLGPLMTAELALPAGAAAAGQLALERNVRMCCLSEPAPPIPGLIIDDLRAE